MAEREPANDDAWIEKVVKIAGALGMNPMRTRWKLLRWQERRRQAARRREQTVEHIRYQHKTCDVCGAVQDRDEKTCSGCGAKLGRREFQVLRRVGLAVPQALSISTLLALAFIAVHVRVLIAAGGGIGSPPVGLLFDFGGHWPPAVAGEPWRLVTAMFLHAGLWHLAFNLLAIAMIGPRVETLYGRLTMLFLFIASGTLASVGSGAFGPDAVGIGASGGVMGLIGAMAGYGHRDGTWAGRTLRNDMLKWSAYTFIFGFFIGADNWAHLFGGIVGAAFGYAVRPARWSAPSLMAVRALAGLIGVVVAIGALVIIFTRVPTPQTVTGYELSYEPYASVCRRHFDGDHAGARRELEAVMAKHETYDFPPEDPVASMCDALLMMRESCRSGSAALDAETCRLVERAFGDFNETPRAN